MTPPGVRIVAGCAAMVGLVACGSIRPQASGCGGATSCVPTATPSTAASAPAGATAEGHGWTTTADLDTANHTIDTTVTVPGPLTVEGGCVPTLVAWAVGPNNARVEASPSPGVRCYAITIEEVAQGKTRTFSAAIPLPPSGTYAIHGLLRTHLPLGAGARVSENLPVVTLTVP